MARLSTQVALGLLTVAVVSIAVMVISQVTIALRAFDAAPTEVRRIVDQIRRGELDPEALDELPVPNYATLLASFEKARAAQIRSILIGLGTAGVLSLTLSLVAARALARPVAAISEAASDLTEGDLGARVRLPPGRLSRDDQLARLARDFNAMAASLERYEHERRAMIADIAHELRTPLNALAWRVEGLLDGVVPLEPDELEPVRGQIALLTRLIDDLRTLSLADAGRLTLQRRPVDLATLARESCNGFHLQAVQAGVRLRCELDRDPEPWRAVVDPDRIAQVLGNLLDNALRVTPAGGEVTVALATGERELRLSVSDTGPGIPAAELPRLFERFTQHKDTSGKSGLGLAVSRTLVELHGGTVTAENLERGARFTVRLPLEPTAT